MQGSGIECETERPLAFKLNMDRRIRLGLCDVDQLLARKFQQRKKRHHQMLQVRMFREERREFAIATGLQKLQKAAHFRAHRKLFARHEMVPIDPRALYQRGPRQASRVTGQGSG